jgi:hypothetical protein
MGRPTTKTMASAGAAALAMLAITGVVSANAGDTGGAAGPDPSAEQVRSCLTSHGVDAPDGDALSLKQWLGEHSRDAAYQDAFIACDIIPADPEAKAGCTSEERDACATAPADDDAPLPSADQLRSCLSSHGVDAPDGDPLALKQWLGEKQDALGEPGEDAAYRDAFIACDLLVAKPDASRAG